MRECTASWQPIQQEVTLPPSPWMFKVCFSAIGSIESYLIIDFLYSSAHHYWWPQWNEKIAWRKCHVHMHSPGRASALIAMAVQWRAHSAKHYTHYDHHGRNTRKLNHCQHQSSWCRQLHLLCWECSWKFKCNWNIACPRYKLIYGLFSSLRCWLHFTNIFLGLVVLPIIVHGLPSVLERGLAGSNYSLSCVASSYPPPTFSWFHNQVELQAVTILNTLHDDESLPLVTSSLNFTQLDLSDEGVYHCNASNSLAVFAWTYSSSGYLEMDCECLIIAGLQPVI